MIGCTELLNFRIKHGHVPKVIHLHVGEGRPIHDIPCEIFIRSNESAQHLDLRAIKDLTLACYLTELPTHKALEYIDAVIAADPEAFTVTYFEDEIDEVVLRWWKRGRGWVKQWDEAA
jgi:hypothetical protein